MRNFDYTLLANKKWDNEILGLIAKIHEYKGRQEIFANSKPAVLNKLIEIAKIQSTEASNKIEGIITTNTRVKELFSEKTTPKNRDEEEILGYRDVLNTIHESHEYIPIHPSYILQLHRDLYKYSEKSIGGRFKNTQNVVAETKSDGSQFVRFTPIPPYETPAAIEIICDSYNKVIDSCLVEPLLLIPIFINDFLCIHPFNDGNGRMSRLLTTLLLYQNGYFIGKYISIERLIEKNKTAYYDSLEKSGIGWHEDSNDSTYFIKYVLKIILSAYRDFEKRVNILGEKKSSYEQVKTAIEDKIGKFTKNDIMEILPSIGKSTVENCIKKLIDENEIKRHGRGKNTFYTRTNKHLEQRISDIESGKSKLVEHDLIDTES